MIAYFLLRILLAVALLYLLRAGLPRELRQYLIFMVGYDLLPQGLYSTQYGWAVRFPLKIAEAILVALAFRALFRLLANGRTYWWERLIVIAFSACMAVAIVSVVLSAWMPNPANGLQMIEVVRQYYRLALFTGWALVLFCFIWLQPVHPDRRTMALGLFWLLWLGCQFAMSTTGGGCLLFHVIQRDSGPYYGVSTVAMGIQAVALVWCRRELR